MNLDFKLCQHTFKGIVVSGYDDYPAYDNTFDIENPFTFEDSVTLNSLTYLGYDGEDKIVDIKISEHVFVQDSTIIKPIPAPDETLLKFREDGMYSVSHLLIPTKEWVIKRLLDTPNLMEIYPNGVFYYVDQKLFQLTEKAKDSLEEVELEDGNIAYTFKDDSVISKDVIAQINTEDSNILRTCQETFSIADLKHCFYNICKMILSSSCVACETEDLKSLIKDRDLVWMLINVINYCIDLGLFREAQRHLLWIENCGSPCFKYEINKNGGNKCGCGRKS